MDLLTWGLLSAHGAGSCAGQQGDLGIGRLTQHQPGTSEGGRGDATELVTQFTGRS